MVSSAMSIVGIMRSHSSQDMEKFSRLATLNALLAHPRTPGHPKTPLTSPLHPGHLSAPVVECREIHGCPIGHISCKATDSGAVAALSPLCFQIAAFSGH